MGRGHKLNFKFNFKAVSILGLASLAPLASDRTGEDSVLPRPQPPDKIRKGTTLATLWWTQVILFRASKLVHYTKGYRRLAADSLARLQSWH